MRLATAMRTCCPRGSTVCNLRSRQSIQPPPSTSLRQTQLLFFTCACPTPSSSRSLSLFLLLFQIRRRIWSLHSQSARVLTDFFIFFSHFPEFSVDRPGRTRESGRVLRTGPIFSFFGKKSGWASPKSGNLSRLSTLNLTFFKKTCKTDVVTGQRCHQAEPYNTMMVCGEKNLEKKLNQQIIARR